MPVLDSLAPGESLVRRTETTTYERGGGLIPWLLALVLVPTALAVLTAFTPVGARTTIQDDLTTKAKAALTSAGLPGAAVTVDGVIAKISRIRPDQADTARRAVESVPGVWSAEIAGGTSALRSEDQR